jgi:hypothetical protein
MMKQIRQEPVLFQGVIQSTLALGTAFGLSLSPTQMGAIFAFTAALLAFWTRTMVTPMVNPRSADGTPLVSPNAGAQPSAAASSA